MLAENSISKFPCSDTGSELKNAKLGSERTAVENSSVFDLPLLLWKENPPDSERGIDGSTMKEDNNDDLHVCAGDLELKITGAAVPKLMSSFLVINEAEKEPPPASNPPKLCFSFINGSSESTVRSLDHA